VWTTEKSLVRSSAELRDTSCSAASTLGLLSTRPHTRPVAKNFSLRTKHPTLGHTALHSVPVTSDWLYISIPPRAFSVCQETHLNSYDIATISSAVSTFKSSAISRRGDWYIVTDVSLEFSASIFRVQAF
jgi:hypothetical protein